MEVARGPCTIPERLNATTGGDREPAPDSGRSDRPFAIPQSASCPVTGDLTTLAREPQPGVRECP